MHQQSKNAYKVIGKKMELDNVVTIQLITHPESSVPSFIPGQYINVFLQDPAIAEGKSYSISSTPRDNSLSITVKEMGVFSKHLTNLNVGDTIEASEPYGYFYSENNDSRLIFIVAGIGITPVMSMLRFFLKSSSKRKIELFYSNSLVDSILFKNELQEMAEENPSIQTTFFITKEDAVSDTFRKGRMSPALIVAEVNSRGDGSYKDEYFICGSIHFVRDMWNGLRSMNISEEQIYTEAFFSH
jgi:ferredoxin-NADP reductase